MPFIWQLQSYLFAFLISNEISDAEVVRFRTLEVFKQRWMKKVVRVSLRWPLRSLSTHNLWNVKVCKVASALPSCSWYLNNRTHHLEAKSTSWFLAKWNSAQQPKNLPVSQTPAWISGFLYDTAARLPELNRTTSSLGIKQRLLLEMQGPFPISNGFQPFFFFSNFQISPPRQWQNLSPNPLLMIESSVFFVTLPGSWVYFSVSQSWLRIHQCLAGFEKI